MKRSRFTDAQIIAIVKEREVGVATLRNLQRALFL